MVKITNKDRLKAVYQNQTPAIVTYWIGEDAAMTVEGKIQKKDSFFEAGYFINSDGSDIKIPSKRSRVGDTRAHTVSIHVRLPKDSKLGELIAA